MAKLIATRRQWLLVSAVAIVAVAGGVPSAARAGIYTAYTCSGPGGGPAGATSWTITKGQYASIDQTSSSACPGGPFQLNMIGSKTHPANDELVATFRAPANTSIPDYSFWRSVELASPYNYRYFEIHGSSYWQYDTCYAVHGDCYSRGQSSDGIGSENLVQATDRTGVTGLQFKLTCGLDDSSSDDCGAKDPGASFQLYRADITLEDDLDPVIVSTPSGPLVDSGHKPLSGIVPVSLSAADQGGGVYQAEFDVDGNIVGAQTIDSNGGLCQQPYTVALPCKLTASGTVGFNTASVPDGKHTLRILVTDATGTNFAAWGPISIRTANARCNPRRRARSLRMRAGFVRGKHRRRTLTVRHVHHARVRGRLTKRSGKPVRHARICVAARDMRVGATTTPVRSLRTSAKGRFSYRVPRGPSRRIYFVRRVHHGAVSAHVNLRVRAHVRLRASRRSLHNGQVVVLHGQIAARRFARSGLLVELQAQRGPHRWQTFGTTHTNGDGAYRFSYRFTRTLGVQEYHLRAQLPRQVSYPFATGRSRPVKVRVRGP